MVTPAPRTFADLALPRPVVDALAANDLTTLFPIQAAALPDGLSGRDVLGRGRTGSGKTLAFGLALLARVAGASRTSGPKRPGGLVLVPTRELAQQVTDALTPYAAALRLRIYTVVGGLSIERQVSAFRDGVDILIATPGRLEDLLRRDACNLSEVSVTVLDEADQMADMGFLPVVTRLLNQLPRGGQRLLFSATLDGDVDKLVRRFMRDPVTHSVDPVGASVETMTHHVLHLLPEDKTDVAAEIAAGDNKVIMFVRTKHGADRLSKQLARVGVRAAALHGGKSQNARTRALSWLRDGELDALIATNVAARGLHIDGIDLVVNVDPPTEPKDYLHRGGRTARAGESGTVVTLVTPDQRGEVHRMMSAVGIKPENTGVRPGAPELARLTGARLPSGVPIVPLAQQFAAQVAAGTSSDGTATRRRAKAGASVRRSGNSGRGTGDSSTGTSTPTRRTSASASGVGASTRGTRASATGASASTRGTRASTTATSPSGRGTRASGAGTSASTRGTRGAAAGTNGSTRGAGVPVWTSTSAPQSTGAVGGASRAGQANGSAPSGGQRQTNGSGSANGAARVSDSARAPRGSRHGGAPRHGTTRTPHQSQDSTTPTTTPATPSRGGRRRPGASTS